MFARVGALALMAALVQPAAPVTVREFLYEQAPFPSVHASTIVETPSHTLLAAYFGGRSEGADDVEIWLSRQTSGGAWAAPVVMTDTPDMPAWNPVLFQDGRRTWLYFKVGPDPQEWVGARRYSDDDGVTWSAVEWLPAGLLGPVRAKPLHLRDGAWLFGTFVEAGYRYGTNANDHYQRWAAWVERSDDGSHWARYGPIGVPGELFGVIQPAMWQTDRGEIRMLLRATARIGHIVSSSSTDGGRTWSPAVATTLPNPNAGIDVVKLADGRVLLVYNHLASGRGAIHVAVSLDDGATWSAPLTLETSTSGELSYLSLIHI